jgi:hypothetical protein
MELPENEAEDARVAQRLAEWYAEAHERPT